MEQVSTTESFKSFLSRNAARYFEEVSGKKVKIDLEWAKHLYSSSIYRFGISTNGKCHSVVIKRPVGKIASKRFAEINVNSKYPEGRPRVRPLPDPTTKFEYEYAALSAISDYFTKFGDARFGHIRLFDILADHQAIIMENIKDPKLLTLFLRANRFQYPFMAINLELAFQNAGAWLRAFHQLPILEHTKKRNILRSDFIDSIFQLTDFLAYVKKKKGYFNRIASMTTADANGILPRELPLGTGHGDYALHNVFVGANGKVTGFDTLANWQAPIYEDISHFLTALKASKLQAYTFGLAFSPSVIARLEDAFLRGYFIKDKIPKEIIRLFEIQVVLSKWPWGKIDQQNSSKQKKIVRRSQVVVKEQFLYRYLNQLLSSLNKY